MPSLSTKIYTQLNFKEKLIGDTFELSLPAGHAIGTPQVLFRELKDKDVAEYRSKYGGAQQKASDSFPADIRGIFYYFLLFFYYFLLFFIIFYHFFIIFYYFY